VLLERAMQPAFSQIALITATLYRPFEELLHFTTKFLNSALNLLVKTHFHSLDILHWKQITFPHVAVISKTENIFDVKNHTF
jgi:hypothetical protein